MSSKPNPRPRPPSRAARRRKRAEPPARPRLRARAYLLHPEELVEVKLHLLHQVEQLQVSALPASRRPHGHQKQEPERRQERRESGPAALRKSRRPGTGSPHRAGLRKVTRRAEPAAKHGDVAGSAG